jgi:hypothetical protein
VIVEMSAPLDVFQLALSLTPRFTLMQFAAQLGGLASFLSGCIALAMVIVEQELVYKLMLATWLSPLCFPPRKLIEIAKKKEAERKEAARLAKEVRDRERAIAQKAARKACDAVGVVVKALLAELPGLNQQIGMAQDAISLLKMRAAKAAAEAAVVARNVREDVKDIKRMYLAAQKEALRLVKEAKLAEREAKMAAAAEAKAEKAATVSATSCS